MRSQGLKVFSFSGIDGAGKSTQIDALRQHLQEIGLRVGTYEFWDDVVVLARFRERMSLSVFKGDRGVGSPDRPIVRRDKNVTSASVVAFRLFLYLLDALRLCIFTYRTAENDHEPDVVIFDRYIYDELANLPLNSLFIRVYIRLLLKLVPQPDFAFLIDAEPEAACARKPEYPLEFVRSNRNSYLRIARMGGMTILPPAAIGETSVRIRRLVASISSNEPQQVAPALGCSASEKSLNGTS